MTERRPHWSDDLIVAVGDAIEHADPTVYPTVGMVNDVIAAVEDWQVANARDRVYLAEPTSAEQAAIARVRHLATTGILAAPDLTEFDKGYNTALLHLQKSLEGGSDD